MSPTNQTISETASLTWQEPYQHTGSYKSEWVHQHTHIIMTAVNQQPDEQSTNVQSDHTTQMSMTDSHSQEACVKVRQSARQ